MYSWCYCYCLILLGSFVHTKTVHYKKVLDTVQKTYELPVPGSNPITIIEADQPLWQQDKLHFHFNENEDINDDESVRRKHRSYRRKFPFLTSETSVTKKPYDDSNTSNNDDESSGEFTATDLNKFLQEYTKRLKIPMRTTETPSAAMEKVDLIERPSASPTTPSPPGYIDKSKATWEDERKGGWVTLEAVPWSTSKVSKWESNKRPSTHWSDPKPYNRPPFDVKPSRPNYNSDYASHYGLETAYNRPNWDKNDYEPMFDRHRPKDCHRDIITDNQPGNFPTQSIGFVPYAESYERPSYEQHRPGSHPATYPDSGDGQWVLLSTTKGYQYPKKRQRSLEVKPDVLSTRKSVHLTVLPALNGSDVNMTTSHGGLLQVDSLFESVDEARRSYIRKLKLNATRKGMKKGVRRPQQAQQVATNSNAPDPTAVLAAVGAGMVPATMAMVMPMVLGRKRRRRRNVTRPPYAHVSPISDT